MWMCMSVCLSLSPSNVMFWDMRPSSQKKTAQTKPPIAPKSDNPFNYLDLVWKPFLKASILYVHRLLAHIT